MEKINYKDDVWIVNTVDKSVSNYYTFSFVHIKPDTLKSQFKDYFFSGLKIGFIEKSSLHRYSYALVRFTKFLEESNIKINYFSELTGSLIDRFIIYLKSTCNSSSTMVLSYTALKQCVRYGQNLGMDLYPKKDIFPLESSRIFGQVDTLKTRLFSDEVAFQLEDAIDKEKDIYLKTAMMIAYETGLRISEVLNVLENSIINDFAETPLLFTNSYKSKEERCVPLTVKCEKQIRLLENYTKDFRIDKKIFTKKYKYKSGEFVLTQSQIRDKLKKFLTKNNIVDETGEIAYVIFHGFRHNVGTNYLNSGASAEETKNILGHKSLHSTNLYAKIKPKTRLEAYKKIGFIGISESDLYENIENSEVIINEQKIIEAALPDGICLNAFEGEKRCEKFNVCLLCKKFRTTVDDLPTHIQHLNRLRANKDGYMSEMSIGNIEYLEKIEIALETIIEQLEAIKDENY